MPILIFLVQFLPVYLSGGARWIEGQYIRSQPLFHRSLILRNVLLLNALSRAICPKVMRLWALRKISRSTSNSAQTFQMGCPGPQLVILLIIDLKSNCLFQASQEVFCKRTDFIVLLVAELSNLRFRV